MLERSADLCALLHRDGLHHPAGAEQLPADPAAMSANSSRHCDVLECGDSSPLLQPGKGSVCKSGETPPPPNTRPAFLPLLFFPAVLSPSHPNPPRSEVPTADGLTHSGILDQLAADWSLRLLNGETPIAVKGADVVSVRR